MKTKANLNFFQKLSPAWRDFLRAFLVTFVLDGAVCLFVLSGMR